MFGEYGLAAWAYGSLKKFISESRSTALETTGRFVAPQISADINIFSPVIGDLKSDNRERQQEAYQLLSSLGQPIIPQIIETIKREDNFRARQMGAELVKNSGPEGIELLKKALMGENRPDDRARILDIIDSVTKDITAELADTLSDNRDVVRRAAFRLAERLNTSEIIQMMIEFSGNDDANLAAYALGSLGKLKASEAGQTIIDLLQKSDTTEVIVAACRAIAQIGDPSCIPTLGKLLNKRSIFGKKKYDPQVRVAAAYALSQIPGPEVQNILNAAAQDPDYRVRETVKQALAKK